MATEESKMLESQRVHLRLFLEGIEVPVISASVSASVGAAASATVQIPGHDSALYILPKTMVHVFFYDWEGDHLGGPGVGPYTEGVGKPLQTPLLTESGSPTTDTLKDLQYKLLFCGEVISVNVAKDGFGSQTITLACSDCSSVLDTAYLFQTQYHSSTAGLINQDRGFYGSNSNPFDDIISTPERVVSDFIKQNKPVNPAIRETNKTIVGGLFAFFEVLLGVHGYSYGLDTFYTVQERRLRLMEQIVSDSGEVATELFDAQVFEAWISNKIGGTPAVMSFREVSELILNYVFYQQVPNPVAFYQWGSREIPDYGSDVQENFEAVQKSLGGNSKEASDFLKLDAHFAEAALEVLKVAKTLTIQYDTLLKSGYVGSGVSVSSTEEAEVIEDQVIVVTPSPFFSATFRDYQKRAELKDIDPAKAASIAVNYAHDQGLAVDVSSGLVDGWSFPPEISHLRNKATYWSFLGVKNQALSYWEKKQRYRTNGFAALLYTMKSASQTFATLEDFQFYIETKIRDYIAVIDSYDAEKLKETIENNNKVLTHPQVLRESIDEKNDYKFLDFWLTHADMNDLENSLLQLVEATIQAGKEANLWYQLLGKAIDLVDATGKFDPLRWGGSWSDDSDIMNLMALFGKVGWDPVHFESRRFKAGVMTRDPEILNNRWEDRKGNENYTPSVADIIEAGNKQVAPEDLVGADKESINALYQTGVPSPSGRERLLTQIFRPDVWFCPPPMCNNIFPEEYSSLTFSRPMMREVTRLKLTSYHQLMEDVVVNKYYFAPQFRNSKNLEQKGIGEVAKVVLYPHEIYTGIIPKIQKLSEASFYTKAGAEIQKDVGDLNEKIVYEKGQTDPTEKVSTSEKFTSLLQSYGARVAHFHLLTARYASRSGSVLGRFMPRIVAGFPAAIYQKTYNNQSSISTALSAGLEDYLDSSSREIFDKTKPVHYQCLIQSVTHTISQQQANTSISFTHARSHKTDSATDDLLSTMAKDGGFDVTSAKLGAAATDKTFDTISITTEATHGNNSAAFLVFKEFYDELFHAPLDSHEILLFNTGDKVFDQVVCVQNRESILAKKQYSKDYSKIKSGDGQKLTEAGAAAQQADDNDSLFWYKPHFRQGKAYYYTNNGLTFSLNDLQYSGVDTGVIYEAPEGQSDYVLEDGKVLFNVEITGSFTEKLPWDTAVYVKVPITNSDPEVKDNWRLSLDFDERMDLRIGYDASGNNLVWKPISLSPKDLLKKKGAAIHVGPLGRNKNYGGEAAIWYEYLRGTAEEWEGYLYVKIRPKFTLIKLFYGAVETGLDTATTSETKEPWEVTIRPGWFSSKSYSNTNIGKTYERMFGCTSVISKYNLSPLAGYSTVSTEQSMDRIIADYSSQKDPIKWIYNNCSRGDANLIEVLGAKESGKEAVYTSGGYHSGAVGNFSKLEGLDIVGKDLKSLLDPSLKKVQINSDDQQIDPRQSRRNAILYYLSTIMTRGIRS